MQVSFQVPIDVKAKQVGYGLPCANCRAYYGADLTACPICGCPERVPADAGDPGNLDIRLAPKRQLSTIQ